jgi:signal recognition particle subunit SRP54
MACCPKWARFANLPDVQVDESRYLKRIEAIINSMTARRARRSQPDRRQAPQAHRSRQRHFSVQEVNQVLKQYADMKRMLKQYGKTAGRMRGIGKLAGLQ